MYMIEVDINEIIILMLPFIRFPSRIKENGQERVEIEEDGVLMRVLINGKTTHWCHRVV